jgi:hypothetical protein
MDPPVLSSPVLFCGHARFGQMSESMRTKSGQNADTNPAGALRTRLGRKRLASGHHRPRAGHLSRASACGHAWTSVRIKADRMRTKSGQMSASKRTKCGHDADEKRTRPRLWSVSLAGSAASLWTPSASSRWPTRFAADDFAPILPHSVRRCRVISVSVRHRRSARKRSQHPLGASLAVKVRQCRSESGKVRFRPSDASQAECRGFESRLPLCGALVYTRRSRFPPSFAPIALV